MTRFARQFGSLFLVAATACGGSSDQFRSRLLSRWLTGSIVSSTTNASSQNPAIYGQAFSFTATVTGASGQPAPTGTVAFADEKGNALSGSPVTLTAVNGTNTATATISGSSISAGSHTVQATYSGDPIYASGQSAAFQTVNPASAQMIINSQPASPSQYGQGVSLSVIVGAVLPSTATPAGNVDLFDGSTKIGTIALQNGTGALPPTTALAVGAHHITGAYSDPQGNFNPITQPQSPTLTFSVDKAGTSVAIASSDAAAVHGETVTFTATVTVGPNGSGAPTGTVQFFDGNTALGAPVGVTPGATAGTVTAQSATGSLTVATHSITASYSGDDNFAQSTSPALSQAVSAAGTTTIVTSTGDSSYGDQVTFTAQVAAVGPGTGTPTGAVLFSDGNTALGPGTLDATGKATFTTGFTALHAGQHTINASYATDGNFGASTASMTQNVSPRVTDTLLSSSRNPVYFGQSFTLSATVNTPQPPATNTAKRVGIYAGEDVTGGYIQDVVAKLTAVNPALSFDVHGVDASVGTLPTPASGELAQYDVVLVWTDWYGLADPVAFGDALAAYLNGGGRVVMGAFAFQDPADPSTSGVQYGVEGGFLAASPVTLGFSAQGVNESLIPDLPNDYLLAGVTSFNNGNGGFFNAVKLVNGGTQIAHLIDGSPLVAELGNVVALNFLPPSSDVDPNLWDATTSGAQLMANAIVGPPPTQVGPPTGLVQFSENGALLGTGTLVNGVATLTVPADGVSWPAVAAHNFTATYVPDADYQASSSSLTQNVNKMPTNAALDPLVKAVFSQPVTLTATVSQVEAGGGTPAGTITFTDNGAQIGQPVALDTATGKASVQIATLTTGDHTIVATYSGNDQFETSSAQGTQTIQKADASVSVATSKSSTVFGEHVIFTATVAQLGNATVTPTGSVTFSVGTATLAANVALVNGVASLDTTALPVGAPDTITATYSGDDGFNGNSGTVAQTVIPDDTSTAVVSDTNPAAFGQNVTFTATVTIDAAGSGIPTGNVSFVDGGTTLASVAISGTAPFTATFSTAALAVGPHDITAVYSGDTNFGGSTSGARAQSVIQGTTSVAVTSSLDPSTYDGSVTFTAAVSVTTGKGSPTGTIAFTDGTTVLGTSALVNGSASFTTAATALAAGNHTISANYQGDTNFSPSSSSLPQQVNPRGTATALTSSVNPSVYGQPVSLTATVSPVLVPTDATSTPGALVGTYAATDPTWGAEVASKLRAAGYTVEDHTGRSLATPSLDQLKKYAAVLVYSDSPFGDPKAMGDVLADYVDAGGHVAVATFATNSMGIGGRLVTGGYLPFSQGLQTSQTELGLVADLPNDPLLAGVRSFDGGSASYHSQIALARGATLVAHWSDGTPLVTFKGRVVGLNFFPPSSDSRGDFWNSGTDGARLLANALLGSRKAAPTGVVEFDDGSTVLGQAALTNGVATLTIPISPAQLFDVATHSLTAKYLNDPNYVPSFGTLSQVVNAAQTTIALGQTTDTVYSEPATLSATVAATSPGAGTPSGTVTFTEGGVSIGSAQLDGNGVASIQLKTLSVGTHAVDASYAGDGRFVQSNSTSSASQVVGLASSKTSVATSKSTSVLGETVTFTATVGPVAPATATPTGSVTFSMGGTVLADRQPLTNGVASFSTSALPVGRDTITASYNGDDGFDLSSGSIDQTVTRDTATTVVVSNHNPAVFGDGEIFTAVVTADAPGSGIPTGSVDFYDGNTRLASGVLDPTGTTTFTPGNEQLTGGTHVITAVYSSGDTNFLPSPVSAPVTQTVTAYPDAVTSLSVDKATSRYGEPILFSAAVSPCKAAGSCLNTVPTGAVRFMEGGVVVAIGQLDANGKVQAAPNTPLITGKHTIVAAYQGDANYQPFTSAAVTELVNRAETATTVASAVTPTLSGQAVKLTANVVALEPATGTPTGSVLFVFTDGSASNVIAPLTNGVATATLTSLPVGQYPIAAVYVGSPDYATSTSAPLNQVVNIGATTSALVASNTAPVYGEPVTMTATFAPVSPAAGVPTGSVTFSDGDTALATVALDGKGKAQFTSSTLAVGQHGITAAYAGDARYTASASEAVTLDVSAASTTVALSSSSAPSAYGQLVLFTAKVASVQPGQAIPAGTVTFADGDTTLGTANLDGTGTAVFSTTALATGAHAVVASYAATDRFSGSVSAPLAQQVVPDGVAVTLSSSAAPSSYGDSVTVVAKVAPVQTAGYVPTGSVTFVEGDTNLGVIALDGGAATLNLPSLTGGLHKIVATYSGDANYSAAQNATATIFQQVNVASTTAVASVSASPSMFGQALTITATLTSTANGLPLTGNVVFGDAGQYLGTVALAPTGTATLTVDTLPVGVRSLWVKYAGDTNYGPATSAVLHETIGKASTSLAVTSSANPSASGQGVIFTATLPLPAAGQPLPTGSVTFLDGESQLGSATLGFNGQATIAVGNLAVATHNITAVYAGDANYLASTAPALAQVVTLDAVGVTLTSSLNPSTWGEEISVSALVQVGAPGSGVPTGTVTFSEGAGTLGTVTLDADGNATLKLPALPVGTHNLTATYSGDGAFTAGSATLSQSVSLAPTAVGLLVPQAGSVFGQEVDLVATVSSTHHVGTPDGTITFFDGATALGTATVDAAGRATFSSTTWAVGTHSLTAVYTATAQYAASSSAVSQQVVTRAATQAALVSSANPAAFGQPVTFTVAAAPQSPGAGALSGAVTLYDGSTAIGSGELTGGKVTITLSSLAVGSHALRAVYAGDGNFTGSSSALTQVVSKDAVLFTLSSTKNPATYGDSIAYKAVVAAAAPGANVPGGTVQFFEAGTLLASVPLDATGTATFTPTLLAAGSHTIAAAYLGDGNDAQLFSSAMVQTVSKGATRTTVSPLQQRVIFGGTVQVTVNVYAFTAGVNGTVTLNSGSDVLGTAKLDANGSATFAVPITYYGKYNLVASFSGSDNFAASSSPLLAVQVDEPLRNTPTAGGCSSTGSAAPLALELLAAAIFLARRRKARA